MSKTNWTKRTYEIGNTVNYWDKNGEEANSSNQRRRMIKMTMPTFDRLSALPDEILIHILSLVNGVDSLKHAAVTCVLSKRWQFLWSEMPKLDFYDRSLYPEQTRNFVSWVHRTIICRSRSYLEDFQVNFLYNECYALDVNAWVRFAVKHKPKCLTLQLHTQNYFYKPPQVLYSCPTLTRLCLDKCIVAPQRKIEWPSLTWLDVHGAELPQEVVENILSGCPVLYRLGLILCWGYNKVHSESLRDIMVIDNHDKNNADLLEISAPYLSALHVSFSPKEKKLLLTNVPSSLESAQIRYTYELENSMELMNSTMELLEKTRHAQLLVLGGTFVEVLSEIVTHGWQLPQSRRSQLTLETSRHKEIISGILCLLESSPNLKELCIQCIDSYEESARTWDPAARNDLDCDLLNLKTVRVLHFADPKLDGEPMLTMARILLKRATTLKNLVFKIEDLTAAFSTNFTEMSQAVHSYPKSSEEAVVVFHESIDEDP